MTATVGHILKRKGDAVHAVGLDACVSTAVQIMNVQRIGSVLVLENDALHGLISERDVLHRVISDGRSPEHTRVEDVMTRRLWTVTPETPVREALSLVSMTRCRHLPVLHGERVVGLVSLGDLTAWIVRELRAEVVDLTAYIHGSASDRALDEAQSAYEIQSMRGRGLGVAYPATHQAR